MRDSNEFLTEIFNLPPMLSTFFTSILFLSIQLPYKKNKTYNWALIWSQKGLIVQKHVQEPN